MEENVEKKRKLDVDEEVEENKTKAQKTFSAVDFRRELNQLNLVDSLKEFLKLAHQQNDFHIVTEYLEAGGSVQEILLLLDKTAMLDLTSAITVFNFLHLVFMSIKGKESEFYAKAEDGAKFMLDTFMPTIEGMMKFNNNKHRKAVLKVLTSVVTLFPSYGRIVMNLIPSTPADMSQFIKSQSGADSLRKWFIFFILSFIMSGDTSMIKSLMNMKGLLSEIMLGLKNDDAHTVNVFLAVVKQKILENVKINKTLKLNIFYTQVIVALFEIYNWKEQKNTNLNALSKKKVIKEKVIDKDEKELVTESVHAFLLVLCGSKKYGVAFTDNTFGVTGEGKNSLLSTVIKSVPEFWGKKRMSEAVISMVQACPDLLGVVLSKTASAISPRESKKWISLIQFVERLLEAISPRDILKTAAEVSEVDLVRLAKYLCFPSNVISQMNDGIRKKNSFSVIYHSMRILTLLWRKTKEVLIAFEGQQKLKRALTRGYSHGVSFLDMDEILEMWENVCKLPKMFETVQKQQFFNVILDYLEMGVKCEENQNDSPSRITIKMLDALEEIHESLGDIDYLIIQSRIFYLVIDVDPMSMTPDTDLFRKALILLLTNNSKTAIESVAKIALSTGVFQKNESEIDIWLACYFENFQEYQHSVPGVFSDCICRLHAKKVGGYLTQGKKVASELTKTDSSAEKQGELTPMLGQFLEVLKGQKKVKDARNYISHVAFRLYHYYNNNSSITKTCRGYDKEIADAVASYLESGDITEFVEVGSDFLMKAEKRLLTWIIRNKKHSKLETPFSIEETYNFNLLLAFNTITSQLMKRVNADSLTEDDVSKFSSIFSFFTSLGSSSIAENQNCVLSLNVEDPSLLRMKCLQCLFSLPLVERFNVCEYEKENVMSFARIIMGVLVDVSKEDLSNLAVFQPWKRKILDSIGANLRDNSKTKGLFERLEPILDRFSYTTGEVTERLNEYSNIADMTVFIADGRVTLSTMIMTKFLKIQSEFAEISESILKKLREVMAKVIDGEETEFRIVVDCFIHLLKNRPKTLSLIKNDFLESLLLHAESGEDVIELGRLLLREPSKVDHFISFTIENFRDLKNKKLIVAMFSFLVHEGDDPILELFRSRKFCKFWKASELTEKDDAAVKLMKILYEKFKKNILMEKSKNVEIVTRNERFFAIMAKCFLDKESLSNVKNNISEGSFLPEIIHETIIKHSDEDIVESYVSGLLVICSQKLKDAENGACEEEVWSKFGKYLEDIVNLKMDHNWSVLSSSPLWKDFFRNSLRICFNFPNCPSFVKVIRHLIELLYPTGSNTPSVGNIFNMLISHSQFLSSMLQESRLKRELVKLYYSLIKRNWNVLTVKHIPVILASYTGSLSENDVTLLNILRFYEEKNLNINEYEPVVWGEPAIAHYSVKTDVGMSLWRRINMLNVLEMLDQKMMQASLKEFPITRTGDVEEIVNYNPKIYDPVFLLPIFANLLSPGAVSYCLPFVQKGCFAYTICALSSTKKDIRVIASIVLSRFYNHLELVRTMKLKSVWLHFINCLRFTVDDIETNPIPSVVTYFLASTSLELSGEPGDMFSSLQKFVLAKPYFSFCYIPEFLPLFHSSDVNYMKHRRWMLEILRDGFKQSNDLNLVFRTMAVKIILSYFRSPFCSRELKPLVLQVVTNFLKTDKSKLLISEYGLLTWLNGISMDCEKELFPPFLNLLSATAAIIKSELARTPSGGKNLIYPTQLLNILMKILPILNECRSISVLESYLVILLDCLFIMFRSNRKNWCKLNRRKLCNLNNIIGVLANERRIAEKWVNSKYFSDFPDSSNKLEKIYRKIVFIWDVLSRKDVEN